MTARQPTVTSEEVLELLVRRISGVMMVEKTQVGAASRFEEDLHADSLDLVQVVGGVEADLCARGVAVTLPDAALVMLRTVGDAAELIVAHVASPTPNPAVAQTPFLAQGEEWA